MCVNSIFHQLNSSIYFDLFTLFDYLNMALSHSPDIFVLSITIINQTYSKFSWFNIDLVNLRQLLRILQRKVAPSEIEFDLISFKVFDRFIRKNFSLLNCHTTLICSIVMEYIINKLINYLSH